MSMDPDRAFQKHRRSIEPRSGGPEHVSGPLSRVLDRLLALLVDRSAGTPPTDPPPAHRPAA